MSGGESVDRLRRAAAQMRALAEAADGGVWEVEDSTDPEPCIVSGPMNVATAHLRGEQEPWYALHNAEYIAAMHPAVAFAFAAWLDQIAEAHESDPSDYCGPDCTDESWWCVNVTAALAVADAFLGSL